MVPKTPINHSIIIESTSSAIVEVCSLVLSKLRAENFTQEDIFAVHLSVEEAFTNAVKHGNKMQADKKVKIDYSVDLDKIEISMTDEGEGFEPDVVPDPRCGENLYKTEGRGLLLIRSYMDVVEFNKQGNCIRMVKYKGKPSPAAIHRQKPA